MKVKYDTTIDAKYVVIKKGKIHTTKPLNDWLVFDLNKKGEVLGVEVLDASKNNVSIFTDGKNVTWVDYGQVDNSVEGKKKTPNFNRKIEFEQSLEHA